MRAQANAVGVGQLRELGYSQRRVTRLVARGELWRRYRGVYVDARAPATARTQLFAAQLSLDDSAFFSHGSSVALAGLRPLNVHALELTVVAAHTPRREGLRIHRIGDPPAAGDIRVCDGLRCSSVSRALTELAATATRHELDRVLAEAARRRLLHPEEIVTAGAPALRAALAAYVPKPFDKSGFEREFAVWFAAEHPDLPEPQRNVLLDGRWEIDYWWPAYRLAVELDGDPYHCTPDELERDRRKDVWLQRHQIRIVRVTEHRFRYDRASVSADLRHFLSPSQRAEPSYRLPDGGRDLNRRPSDRARRRAAGP